MHSEVLCQNRRIKVNSYFSCFTVMMKNKKHHCSYTCVKWQTVHARSTFIVQILYSVNVRKWPEHVHVQVILNQHRP